MHFHFGGSTRLAGQLALCLLDRQQKGKTLKRGLSWNGSCPRQGKRRTQREERRKRKNPVPSKMGRVNTTGPGWDGRLGERSLKNLASP